MEGIAILIGIVLVVGTIIFAFHQYEKARTKELEAVAKELGLEFHPKGNPTVQDAIAHLRLFNRGHGRKTMNMLCGHREGVAMAIFGYRFRTGGGKHQQTHKQTVFSFQSTDLSLPEFELRPENLFHKIGQAFGYKDIDFDSHPDFSDRYILRSPDEVGVRELFTPERLEFFESHPGVSIEAGNDRLIYYRARKRIDTDTVRSFMEEGFRIYALFKQS